MAQVVCIDKETVREGVCEIDDIVAIHNDDVALTGSGYEGFKIVKIPGRTMAELIGLWKHPEEQKAVKLPTVGAWAFMEEKEVWKNEEGLWCSLVSRPKYSHSLVDLTETDRTDLVSELVSIADKDTILAKCSEKIHMDATNCTEEKDLNTVIEGL